MRYDLSRSSFPEGKSEKGLKLAEFIGIALLLLTSAAGCFNGTNPQTRVWFLEVERSGGYWLSPKVLAGLGLNPEDDSPPTVSLFLEGNHVPLLPLRTPAGWGVFFYTSHNPTRYSSRTVLKLETGKIGPWIKQNGLCPSPSAEPLPWALSLVHLEENERYLPQAELETPWLWKALYAPGKLSFTITLTDALEGPVSVILRIWSHTSFPSEPDHQLKVRWDGVIAGEWQWDGTGAYEFRAQVELDNRAPEHELTLESSLPPGTEASVLWVDYLELTYRRIVRPAGELWFAEGEALKIEGSGPEIYALDVTDPLDVKGCLVPHGGVIPTIPGHRYWIGNPKKAMPPYRIRPAFTFNPDELEGVEYLAIASGEFHRALVPLLEHRKSQGLKVGLAEPRAIYDSFSGGRINPQAIRSLVNSLPSLRYLLIVGDGTALPGGYDGPSGSLLVVSPFTRTREIGETPADVLFGMSDAGEPVVAVGRLPASSPEELALMVDKTLRWERAEGSPYFLLVYDDGPEFRGVAEEIGQEIKAAGLSVELVQGRPQVLESAKRGKRVLGYFGHASLTGFGDEGILKAKDAQEVTEPVLITAWGCLAAHFMHPAQDSMAETWLRSPGGAVAFLGPVGATTLAEQRPLAQAFYRALGKDGRIGDAWLMALKARKGSQIIWGYTLLGDPALIIWQK